ncbi:MAG: PTS sugar transporter subunit IIB [Bacillota bacterium]|nr:PTS sugar transporter subunit IIB [Bacillota bacterium]
MIKAFHMDDRLIHGQVAISWTRSLGINLILIINDEIVNDEFRKMSLKLGVPDGVKYGFRTVEKGIEFLNGSDGKKYNIMALVNNTADALRVSTAVPEITKVTVGGIRKNAPQVYESLCLDERDIENLKEIISLGKPVGMQPTPGNKFVSLDKYLEIPNK